MKPKILFIDDEQSVLDGIADVLSRYRKVWEMEYISSAATALEKLEKQHYDVVVSDMRMPDITGTAVLQRVREVSPSTVRILLSGQADAASLIRSLSNVHHYLSKPCSAETLAAAVERGVVLREMLAGESRASLGSHSVLPTDPNVYWEIMRGIEADVPPRRLASILQSDPAICAKTLQLANSAYFGSNRAVVSVADAAELLGSEWFRLMALSADVLIAFSNDDPALQACMAKLWDRARLVSRLAPSLLAKNDPNRALARTAGILHTLGEQVVLLDNSAMYLEAFESSRSDSKPLIDVLREGFEVDTTNVTVYLLNLWGMPQEVVNAVRAVQAPRSTSETQPAHHRALSEAFAIACSDDA